MTRLSRSGVKLYETLPERFEPGVVAAMAVAEPRKWLSGCGVSQRHGPVSDASSRIAISLSSDKGPVSTVIDHGVGDAPALRADLRTRDAAGRPRFQMLRGPNVDPMWVRMLAGQGGPESTVSMKSRSRSTSMFAELRRTCDYRIRKAGHSELP
ncbi:MAG: hypothetical protein OXG11_01830, partial [Chloroflexi bacterium]|nr:hypothetical protein [Chloroflexota bacterium]